MYRNLSYAALARCHPVPRVLNTHCFEKKQKKPPKSPDTVLDTRSALVTFAMRSLLCLALSNSPVWQRSALRFVYKRM